MIRICRIFKFDSAHSLPYHKGQCNKLHGHTYKLEIKVEGIIKGDGGPENGMVMDFKTFDREIKFIIIDKFDHELLNNFFENPTAENMVDWISNTLKGLEHYHQQKIKLIMVRLWETENSYAEWEAPC